MLLLFYTVGMRLRPRKIAATLAAVLVVVALVPPVSILVTSWHSRWEASRLLAYAKLLHPGTATEAETRKALSPFNRYLLHGEEWIPGHPSVTRDSYDISNYPVWVFRVAPHLPNWVNEHSWFLPYTSFSVSPRFQNGELVLLEFSETQHRKDDIHPCQATVRVFSTSTEKAEPELQDGFAGFQVSPIHEVLFDDNGKRIGSPFIGRTYVALDERASQEQFSRSFNFHLGCLTSLLGCRDARDILAISE